MKLQTENDSDILMYNFNFGCTLIILYIDIKVLVFKSGLDKFKKLEINTNIFLTIVV